jgi:hypothetical protein
MGKVQDKFSDSIKNGKCFFLLFFESDNILLYRGKAKIASCFPTCASYRSGLVLLFPRPAVPAVPY